MKSGFDIILLLSQFPRLSTPLICVEDDLVRSTKIFNSQQVKLVAGLIVKKMKTQGTGYATAIVLIQKLLEKLLRDQVLVRAQLPIQLGDAQPKPSIAVVMPDALRYTDRHPIASEIDRKSVV